MYPIFSYINYKSMSFEQSYYLKMPNVKASVKNEILASQRGSTSIGALVRTPPHNNEQRMQTILAQNTYYICSLDGPEFQEFVDWLERSTIPDADKLRLALLERRQLIEQRDKLDAELYEIRRRRAAKFGPIGTLLFWLTQTPPSKVVSSNPIYSATTLCIILFILIYYWSTSEVESKRSN